MYSRTGNKQFVEGIKAELGSRALKRRIHEVSGGDELRELEKSYNADFDPKKNDIGSENTYE